MKFIHDPECAMTLDVAETADEDLTKYKPPACTCRERQKARRRITSATSGSGTRGGVFSEGQPLGGGNYVRPNAGLSDYR